MNRRTACLASRAASPCGWRPCAFPTFASPWMTPGGKVNSNALYAARIRASMAVRKARSSGYSQLLASIRCAAFANGASSGSCKSSGAVNACSFARGAAISAVLAYWSPSCGRRPRR